ncbi:hypothetical protein [Lysobacter antibioticus]|uniref:hypothetical protein n=1 Tax=Lysobacter antibioticus TaxID=84531 RepID=UPI000716731D|nr:hypothetical protein [Lysobacter antibioticus]
MSEMEITREDVAGRARAGKLAPLDIGRSLETARGIKHPWYRCQALATTAEYMTGRDQERVLSESLAAAHEQDETNRVVTVSSWPIRVLAKIRPELAAKYVEDLVALAETEPHNLRRSHALQSLAYSVSGHPGLLGRVVPALVESLIGGHGPRIDRCIRDTFELVLSARRDLAWTVAMHHKPNNLQSRLLAAIPG